MSGEVNKIQTLRKFRGGPDQANLGGASLETFSGEAQLKKTPCMTSNRIKRKHKYIECKSFWCKIKLEDSGQV